MPLVDRRQYLLSKGWNGIDYVEVASTDQTVLRVHFLNTVAVAPTLGTVPGSPPGGPGTRHPVTITGGEVIVPSLTFAATPHAVVWNGAEPVFADVNDDMSFTIDPADVEARITDKTVAILSVDPYGIACDYEALAAIGRRRGLKVLVDSAPSFGTTVAGRRVG